MERRNAQQQAKKGRKRAVGGGRRRKLLPYQEVLITLVYLRHNVSHAVVAFHQEQPEIADLLAKMRRDLADLEAALRRIAGEEVAAVRAQIAGLQAGASPEAYASVFAALAARRKEAQERRDVLAQSLSRVPGLKGRAVKREPDEAAIRASLLADVREALTSPDVEGVEKRNLLGRVVDKVICRKGGAEVVFAPGLFGADVRDTLHTAFRASSKRVGQRSIRP